MIIRYILVLFFLGLSAIIFIFKEKPEPISKPVAQGEYCYWKTIQPGESFAETDSGVFSYQIYTTSTGVDIWKPCE